MIDLQQLTAYTDKLLAVHRFADYCPNGLQVEAVQNNRQNKKIHKIVAGVTACQQLIDAATDLKADLLLVHHGFFWRNEPAVITGYKARRMRSLMQAGIHLLAYHLPLDFHAELGNNIALARQLNIEPETLSRLLTKFRRNNLISVNGKECVILDPQALCEEVSLPPDTFENNTSCSDSFRCCGL